MKLKLIITGDSGEVDTVELSDKHNILRIWNTAVMIAATETAMKK